jgi:hypothetical protein
VPSWPSNKSGPDSCCSLLGPALQDHCSPDGEEWRLHVWFRDVSVTGESGVEVIEVDDGSLRAICLVSRVSDSLHNQLAEFGQLGRKLTAVCVAILLREEYSLIDQRL